MPISRRELLKVGTVGAFASAMPKSGLAGAHSDRTAPARKMTSESAAMAALSLPVKVEAEIRLAAMRYRLWKGDDETVVFPVVTDIHDGNPDIATPPDWSQPKMHILYAARAAKLFKADFLAELGDFGADRDVNWKYVNLPAVERRYRSQEILLGASSVPVIACNGNHDLRSPKIILPNSHFGKRFIGVQKSNGINFVTGADESYGYLDFPQKRLRAIFLNTSDFAENNTDKRAWRAITSAQKDFVASALKLPSPEWSAVALSHIPLCPGLGRIIGLNPDEGKAMENRMETLKVIEDFVCGGGRFLGVFSGHTHQDWDARENGVSHFTFQGCGTCPYTWILPESRYARRDEHESSLLLDVVALKPKKGVGRIFRIGAGGEAFDRPFPHAAYGATSAELVGNSVHFICPSWLHPQTFTLTEKDFAGKGLFSSDVRDGVRFVRLDLSAGWTHADALEFLRSETARGDLTAVLVNRPLWTPGSPDVQFGNPTARKPKQPWRNYELRDHIVRKTPNLLGVFAPGDGYSLSVQSHAAQVVFPRAGTLEVSINRSDAHML